MNDDLYNLIINLEMNFCRYPRVLERVGNEQIFHIFSKEVGKRVVKINCLYSKQYMGYNCNVVKLKLRN